MSDAIADTGPILHLSEIGQTRCLNIFHALIIPDLVAQELRVLQLDLARLNVTVNLVTVADSEWKPIITGIGKGALHPADAQVFVLARSRHYQEPILTDDLVLRRRLENAGATVVGSLGILVRAYSSGQLDRSELDNAVNLLFNVSTLHASRAFQVYVQQMLKDL